MQKKMSMNKGKSFLETKQKLHTLQTDLQNAGRLSVPQPQIKDYEKQLKNHANKNPYLLSVLYMLMACNKKQFAEQKYLLQQSLQYIENSEKMEKDLFDKAVQDSVFICSTLLDSSEQKSSHYPPFDKLYDPDYIDESEQPRTPILISRSSSVIVLKLPPFNPKVGEFDYLNDPGVKDIRSMVLYGKVSAHGVNVSTTCTDLQNTGTRNQIGSVIQIRGLQQNEGYCFAVAGFNVNEKQSKKIGDTSDQIVTLQPLPINSLYAYLAKQAYWIGEYDIAQTAAEKNIDFFVEKSEVFDRSLDQYNPVVFLRIKLKHMKDVSSVEISQFAESLFIKARCLQKTSQKEKKIEKDKALCIQANLSLLALEACAACEQIVIGKRVLLDLYNNLQDIVKIKSKYLFQILIKMYIFLQEIPKQYWDNKLREFSAKLIYEISVTCFQYNQINLGKLVIYQSSYLPNRKYKAVPKLIEVAEDQGQQQKGQTKGGKAAKEVVQESQQEIKMVSKVVYSLSESPSYQDYLEDALLTFTEEYGDLVAGFLDNWKDQLDFYGQYIENGGEQIENIKNQLSLKWSFWEILKEPVNALQKIQAQFRNQTNYIELLCKFARRQIENNNLKSAKEILQHAETITTDSINQLQEIFNIKLECAMSDIAWNPEKLDQLKSEEESNGDIENQAIELFTKYYEILEKLQKDKYQNLWRAEFFYLKALTLYLEKQSTIKETTPDIYFEIDRLDLDKISININEVKELNPKNLSEEDVQFFKELQSTLAQAAFFSLESDSEYQLKNIIKFAQNINIREQMNPFDVRGSETNIYSYIIGSCILSTFCKKIPYYPELNQTLTKDFWFNKAEMQPYADYSSYIINAVLIEEKFSILSEFCKNFCNATQHYYSNIVIPFLIHAQSILEDKASLLTQERQNFLQQKTQEYENWKNSKRRKNRAAILTGEIPPEEIQYNKDKETIGHQIQILKTKQGRITQKKSIAHSVLQEIQRDANQPQLMLFECKRLLEKFGEDYKALDQEQSQQQKKAHQLFGQTLVRKYKNVIEMLRKRHDNVGLIRALSQIGDLYFATGQLSQAEENWNDALDTIFQRLHSLKNRGLVNIEQNERNCLQACVFLYKLAKYCYFSDFSLQQDCLHFVAELSFQVFKSQMVNPQTLIGFADARNILLPNDLFNQNLDPITTMQACDYLLNGLIDSDMHLKALPLIQIMEYIATKVTFSEFYSTRSKLYKSMVLAKIGMINQSYQALLQVQVEKCGPISLLQLNESIQLNRGSNWFPNNKEYFNNMPFFQDQNKEVIEQIQKLELGQGFENVHSYLNVHLFAFAKIQLLFSIHEQEIIDRPENNEARTIVIKTLEAKLRELLVNIQKHFDQNQHEPLYSGPLQESESREDRMSLIYRSRALLGTMNLALGQFTRAYFIFKTGLSVIQNHMFGFQKAEDGREVENEESQQTQNVNVKDAKKGAKEVKDNKKPGKGVQQEVQQEVEVKFEYKWADLANLKKRKHPNGFWFIKFKFSIVQIFYNQNRFADCLSLIGRLKKDCELLNDRMVIRKLSETEARITIRQGSIDKGLELMEQCLAQQGYLDTDAGKLFGDYAEILFERNQYAKAREYFLKAYEIFANIKKESKFEPLSSVNKKLENEKMHLNEKYEYPSDIMDQLSKKEAKIRKDDKRQGKETVKKDAKNTKQQEIVEMKITPLNQLEKQDLTNVQKSSLKDYQFDPPQQISIYVRFLEDYLRACLRLALCDLSLGQNENVISQIEAIEIYIQGNYNLPQSFKLETQFLLALANKRLFVEKVNAYYQPYIDKYLKEKNKKYKKIHDRLPYRDLPRNKYLLDLPNFSNYLKEDLIVNYLEKAKKAFKSACLIIKGECIFYENKLQIDYILMEMAELILLQREYFPRLEFKHIEHEEDERWQRMAYVEKLDKLNLELESFQIMNYAMSVHSCRKEILQTSLGNMAIPDVNKIPQDLVNEILEADFIYKKKYDPLLFDETKNKKLTVTSLDLVSILNKISNESKLMTFSGARNQKSIQKIHKFLKTFHTAYMQKCMLANLDITSKADINVVFIEDGLLKFKSYYCPTEQEHKFIYILSRCNPSKIQSDLSQEEKDKLVNPEDKDILYGNFQISNQQLSDLELKANNLKSKLQHSEQQVQSVKERDFRRYNTEYLDLFNAIGMIFHQRAIQGVRRNVSVEYSITDDKYYPFIPQLSVQNVDIFVKLFGPEGLELENNHLLLIFRNYHKCKYR